MGVEGEGRRRRTGETTSAGDCSQIRGAFFWDFSVYSNSGIDGTCVLLGAIPIPEWTECYAVHSAPDSRMDRIVFWRENCASAPVSFDHVSYSVFGIARDLFYWELIFRVFCYYYSEIGITGMVPKERSLISAQCWNNNYSSGDPKFSVIIFIVSFETRRKYFVQLTAALEHMHSRRVMHRG